MTIPFYKMISRVLCAFVLAILFFPVGAQTTVLPNEWKFKLGDNMAWAAPSFNDADWGYKPVSTSWGTKEVKSNVYAWYRTKILIPSSMKEVIEKGNVLTHFAAIRS